MLNQDVRKTGTLENLNPAKKNLPPTPLLLMSTCNSNADFCQGNLYFLIIVSKVLTCSRCHGFAASVSMKLPGDST